MKNSVKIDLLIEEGCKDERLDVDVPIYKNGSNEKLNTINGIDFFTKALKGELTIDELKTLHKKDSIVNEKIKEIVDENNKSISNKIKVIINKLLFIRDDPKKLSDKTLIEKSILFVQEFKEFQRLIKEGVFKKNIQYTNSTGKIVTVKSWVLCDEDYEDGDPWFVVKEEEKLYFEKMGYFPLRYDNNNSKLGKHWLYLAFELAWMCSGEAHGGCQCPEYCYARRMENTYKGVRTRVLKMMNAWEHTPFEEKVKFYTEWCKEDNGIRFCDTGDVTNQKLLDEIFELIRRVSDNLKEIGINPDGKFYIYSTRADLDWSNKPWELVLNASNKKLFELVPDANWYKVIDSWDDIPEDEKYSDEVRICNCNCKACNYCAVCRNKTIYEILG